MGPVMGLLFVLYLKIIKFNEKGPMGPMGFWLIFKGACRALFKRSTGSQRASGEAWRLCRPGSPIAAPSSSIWHNRPVWDPYGTRMGPVMGLLIGFEDSLLKNRQI